MIIGCCPAEPCCSLTVGCARPSIAVATPLTNVSLVPSGLSTVVVVTPCASVTSVTVVRFPFTIVVLVDVRLPPPPIVDEEEDELDLNPPPPSPLDPNMVNGLDLEPVPDHCDCDCVWVGLANGDVENNVGLCCCCCCPPRWKGSRSPKADLKNAS